MHKNNKYYWIGRVIMIGSVLLLFLTFDNNNSDNIKSLNNSELINEISQASSNAVLISNQKLPDYQYKWIVSINYIIKLKNDRSNICLANKLSENKIKILQYIYLKIKPIIHKTNLLYSYRLIKNKGLPTYS